MKILVCYSKLLVHLFLAVCFSFSHAGVYEEFFRALELDDARGVSRLLNRGLDPNSLSPTGQPPLALALQLDHFRVAEALWLAPDLQVDQANALGETALMVAAIKGQMSWVERLVRRGAQVRRPGWTPLHYAASGSEPRVVAFLIDAGADVEALSPQGSTALMLAARYGDERGVDVLLARGADPAASNPQGAIAADYARVAGRDRLAVRLERLGRPALMETPAELAETGK